MGLSVEDSRGGADTDISIQLTTQALRSGRTRAKPRTTGFTNFEYAIGGKWLELLKEIAPRVTRAAVLRESAIAAGPAQFGAIQALAPSLGVELRPVDTRDADEIERAITAFARARTAA